MYVTIITFNNNTLNNPLATLTLQQVIATPASPPLSPSCVLPNLDPLGALAPVA